MGLPAIRGPCSGPFTQEDPIGIAGGLNLYGYAGGDPINFSDPFGLCRDGDDDCERIVALLREQDGDVFQAAADLYDKWDGEVDIMQFPGWDATGNPTKNFLGGTTTNNPNRRRVALNADLDHGDLLLAAVHESLHMDIGRGLSDGVDDAEIYGTVAKGFMQLPFPGVRGHALAHYSILRRQGYNVTMTGGN